VNRTSPPERAMVAVTTRATSHEPRDLTRRRVSGSGFLPIASRAGPERIERDCRRQLHGGTLDAGDTLTITPAALNATIANQSKVYGADDPSAAAFRSPGRYGEPHC